MSHVPGFGATLRRAAPGVLIVAVLAAAYLLLFARVLWRNGDEGTIVYGAIRILRGEVPYRDFVDVIGPASFYWLAGWFRLFGTSWFALRAHLLLTWVAIVVMIYWLTRRVHAGPFAFLPCAFYTVVGIPLWPASNHHWDSSLFALIMVLCFLKWQQSKQPTWLVTAGALAAVTTCVIPQKGAGLIAAALCMTVASEYRAGVSRAVRPLLLLLLSYASVLAGVALWFLRAGALGDLFYATAVWPLSEYDAVNGVGYAFNSLTLSLSTAATALPAAGQYLPYLALLCLVPLAMIATLPAMAGALLVRAGVTHAWRRTVDATLATYLVFGLAIWVSELHRPDLNHLMWGAPLLLIGVLVLATRLLAARTCLVVMSVLTLTIVLSGALSAVRALGPHPLIETRRGPVRVDRPDAALEFVIGHVSAGASLFVYPYYPMYYYLADVRMPSRYSILVYDYNTPAQFEEVITELERGTVEFVLWDTLVSGENMKRWFPGYNHPDDQLPMENFLIRNYDEIGVANGFRIMRRRP